MRRLRVTIPAVGAAMVMLVGLAGPAGAGGKASIDPGRQNSTSGLVNAGGNLGAGPGLAAVAQNIARSADLTQPGVKSNGTPGCNPPVCPPGD